MTEKKIVGRGMAKVLNRSRYRDKGRPRKTDYDNKENGSVLIYERDEMGNAYLYTQIMK